jgi:hypothetical protein
MKTEFSGRKKKKKRIILAEGENADLKSRTGIGKLFDLFVYQFHIR